MLPGRRRTVPRPTHLGSTTSPGDSTSGRGLAARHLVVAPVGDLQCRAGCIPARRQPRAPVSRRKVSRSAPSEVGVDRDPRTPPAPLAGAAGRPGPRGGGGGVRAGEAAARPRPARPAAAPPPARDRGPAPARWRPRPPPVAVAEPAAPDVHRPPRGPHKSRSRCGSCRSWWPCRCGPPSIPGAFGNHQKAAVADPLVIGNQVYHSAGCSGCHGANGEGGVGPALHGGQAVLTFPNDRRPDQLGQDRLGPFTGKKYGDPNRAGGQHGPANGRHAGVRRLAFARPRSPTSSPTSAQALSRSVTT